MAFQARMNDDPEGERSYAYDRRNQQRYIARNPPIREEAAAPTPPAAPQSPSPPPQPASAVPGNANNNNGDSPTLKLSASLRSQHRGQLLYHVRSRTFSNKDVWVLNLAEMQRLNLQVMRNRIAKLAVVDLGLGINDALKEKDAKELERVMHAYSSDPRAGEALRDWDYMQQQRDKHEFITDPFKMSSSQARDHSIMEETGLMQNVPSRWHTRLPRRQMTPDDADAPELPGHSRGHYKKTRELREVTERLMYGIVGGLALIGPMLVMVLHNTVLTSLLTVSVATILFAGLSALYLEIGPMQLIGATAAYAAVLVVFVGTTNPST
ncbi:hypothetical protein LOCC1_G008226 [Lachnellula occidentalis]|uniref:DUF6594 domain-containing protein n=1 Tax=Lachnellula occidentalis TaxID=215460 RepID=A0A8H8RRM4_9HELO|nr:hypothetical protein LOCC1_G008226 [Lachnellula occidentalis]